MIPFFRFLTLASLLLALGAVIGCADDTLKPDWDYSGDSGPSNWTALSDDYAKCGEGLQQSPVNLIEYVRENGPQLEFEYNGDVVSAINVGRQVSFMFDDDNKLQVGQVSYHLKSAHLHAPGEHAINGFFPAAEFHLVHADDSGALAVVGVTFQLRSPNRMVQTLLEAAPDLREEVTEGLNIEADMLAPTPGPYFHYEGSKTTPPCNEPVDWYVMGEPLPISESQADVLRELHGGPNNRPIQPRHGRTITLVGG